MHVLFILYAAFENGLPKITAENVGVKRKVVMDEQPSSTVQSPAINAPTHEDSLPSTDGEETSKSTKKLAKKRKALKEIAVQEESDASEPFHEAKTARHSPNDEVIEKARGRAGKKGERKSLRTNK